ncbi:MAG: 4Fe-4S dicluster domain-containing protein [Methanomassiliicoccales archaeon]|jgi:carbon-monoxide dehydrogenase iron sulfur subunit
MRVEADPKRCLGCLACEVACVGAHSPSDRHPRLLVSSGIDDASKKKRYSVSVVPRRFPAICRQCDEPLCVTVCKTGALSKDRSGVVMLDSEKCSGCSICQKVCQFGGIRVDRSLGLAFKCDLCAETGDPACVKACQVQALELVTEG